MLEAALVSNPADPSVRATLSGILLSEGKTLEAIEIARDAVSLTRDPRGYTALGWAYLAANRETEALLAFDSASQMEPAAPEIDAARGCCFTRMGRHPEALQAFREVIARDPDYFDRDEMA